MKYNNQIILAAHRGDRLKYPENTMPAFESALRFGADMIETDVHMTSDGKLVIIHDRNLKRTTGLNQFTDQTSWEEIRTLDAGLWFSPAFTNTSVPTLEEFIDLIKETDILINWELKDYPHNVGDAFAFQAADKLIDAIRKHGLEERSMINSFSDKVLEYIYQKYDHAFTIHGQGIYGCPQTIDTVATDLRTLYDWCCLYPNIKGQTPLDYPENFEYCTQHGILPCVCVRDDLETYKKYLELGCRMFTTNNMYEADKILRELNQRK